MWTFSAASFEVYLYIQKSVIFKFVQTEELDTYLCNRYLKISCICSLWKVTPFLLVTLKAGACSNGGNLSF
ncbi:protein of unknown function [Clostridium beijerinckii]|nr:protein of unknown function [Clostridium beijerinckii]